MNSKTKTGGTQEEATPALVPKLRFPEFEETDGWAVKTFDELFTIGNGRDYKHLEAGDVPVYGSGGYMLSVKDYLYDGESVCIGRKGTINNPMFLIGRFWTVDTLFYTHSFKECLPKFIFAIFQQIDWLKHNEAGGVPSLSKTNIQKIHTAVPKPAEQQKIAECLSSADELIAAQARKVDALKTHKKGLMQQLFPREGETQPRLRFPEFQKGGEWEVKTLEAIAPLQRGFDLPSQEIRPGQVPIVYSNGPKGFHAEGMAIGPGLVTGRSGTIGKLHFIESGAYWPHNTSLWVTSFKGHVPKFVYYLFDFIDFLRFASGSGVPTLNRNDAHSFETSVPPTPPEQQRIASCLSSLDNTITAEIKKLEALKTHKKGLMQQLFPSLVEER
jgi:type I restriction enzyme S subunit